MTWYPNSTIPYPFSGIRSGFVIHPYHVSFLYDELSGIEQVLGLNPLNGWPSITERISGIESGYWNISQDSVLSPLFIVNNGGVSILSGQIATSLQNGFLSAVDRTSFDSRVFRAGDTITGGLTVLGFLSGLKLFDSGSRPVGFIINGGAGETLVGTKSDNVYSLKGLVAGAGIQISSNATDITLTSTGGSGTSISGLTFVGTKYNELPTGSINSSNKVYTLVFPPINNSLEFYYNGVLLNQSGIGLPTFDYVLSGSTVTTISAPTTGSSLSASYQYSSASGYGIYAGISAATATTLNAVPTWGNTNGTLLNNSNMILTSTSMQPLNSGTMSLGQSGTPFASVASNQYSTTRVSGNITSATYTLNWDLGSSQAIGFTAGFLTGVTLTLVGGLPGSSYVLEVYNNASGTAAINWGTNTKWQNRASGIPTSSGNAIDLFNFYYNGSSYLSAGGFNFV